MKYQHLARDRVYLVGETFVVIRHSEKENGETRWWAVSFDHAFEYDTPDSHADHTKIIMAILDEMKK